MSLKDQWTNQLNKRLPFGHENIFLPPRRPLRPSAPPVVRPLLFVEGTLILGLYKMITHLTDPQQSLHCFQELLGPLLCVTYRYLVTLVSLSAS